jgi:hypothetical protein
MGEGDMSRKTILRHPRFLQLGDDIGEGVPLRDNLPQRYCPADAVRVLVVHHANREGLSASVPAADFLIFNIIKGDEEIGEGLGDEWNGKWHSVF